MVGFRDIGDFVYCFTVYSIPLNTFLFHPIIVSDGLAGSVLWMRKWKFVVCK